MTHPTMSAAVLFGVPFYSTGTGGGCQALRADLCDGTYLLMTDHDLGLPRANDWILAHYAADTDGLIKVIGANSAGAYYL